MNNYIFYLIIFRLILGHPKWRGFMTHPYFGNCVEEFYLHKTLSTPIKLLSSLLINTVPHQYI